MGSDDLRVSPGKASLFYYGRAESGECFPGAIHAVSKLQAIVAATRWREPVDLVLVWHIALLKLLPFFRFPDARIVLFLHGIEAWQRADWLTRKVLPRVSGFLTNSEYTWRRFRSLNPETAEASHRTVPLGIGSTVDEPVANPSTSPVILMVGRLLKAEDYKGHREMINAWPIVLRRNAKAELWIVGDGDLKADLEELVQERRLQRSIHFLGYVSEKRKDELIRQCRCLALPSRAEGFGLVYLEAMRMGRPCLVSDSDAGREVVNPPEAGLAVDPDNVRELADAVSRMLAEGPEWRLWSTNAKTRYEALYTSAHFQERLIAALR